MPPRTPSSSSDTELHRRRTGIRAAGLALAILASAAAGAPGAAAQGGAVYVEQPRIAKASCVRRCASRHRAQPGSTLRIVGRGLANVTQLTFHGSAGARDDVRGAVRSGSSSRLTVVVPIDAVSGPVSVGGDNLRSPRTRPLTILPAPPPEPNPTLTPVTGLRQSGAPRLETGTSRTRAFLGAKRTVTFSYRITAGDPAAARLELLRVRDGAVVRSWVRGAKADSVQKIAWNGKVGRLPAPPGRYAFRLTVAGSHGELATSARVEDFSRDAFDLYDHVFPVRGAHYYGSAGARFGAGRGGRSHQGQDLFARCGTPMVAARGGRVQFSGYHAAAGNYIVIDGDGTAIDYSYMHLVSPSPFRTGDRVYTGQRIGEVGDTGNAHGCHLHYELWAAPGWYEGGSPFDPLPALKAWDLWS